MGLDESMPVLPEDERILSISGDSISSIPYTIKDYKQIEQLIIVKSQIKKFPIFPNLQYISYNYASLSSIPQTLLTTLLSAKIEAIDFSDNKITSIPNDLIQIPTIQHIILFNNLLKSIEIRNSNALI